MKTWEMLKYGRKGSAGFDPYKYGSVVAWWDFSDTATVTVDGSNKITRINDKSSTGCNLVPVGAGRVTYNPTGLNGMGIADATGSAYDTIMANTTTYPTSCNSMIAIYKWTGQGTNAGLFGSHVTFQNYNVVYISGSTGLFVRNNAAYFSGATSASSIVMINEVVNDLSPVAGNWECIGMRSGSGARTQTSIGSMFRCDNTTTFYGYIAEAVFWSSYLDATTLSEASLSLRKKWGLV